MKKLIIIIVLLFLVDLCVGQIADSTTENLKNSAPKLHPKNYFYAELLGNSMFYSINYERAFFTKYKLFLTLRSGLCYIPEKRFGTIGIPVLTNGILKLYKNIHFELGAGILIMSYSTVDDYYSADSPDYLVKGSEVELTAAVGLRVMTRKGFLFRADYTPIFMTYHKDFVSWGGISLGYCF